MMMRRRKRNWWMLGRDALGSAPLRNTTWTEMTRRLWQMWFQQTAWEHVKQKPHLNAPLLTTTTTSEHATCKSLTEVRRNSTPAIISILWIGLRWWVRLWWVIHWSFLYYKCLISCRELPKGLPVGGSSEAAILEFEWPDHPDQDYCGELQAGLWNGMLLPLHVLWLLPRSAEMHAANGQPLPVCPHHQHELWLLWEKLLQWVKSIGFLILRGFGWVSCIHRISPVIKALMK